MTSTPRLSGEPRPWALGLALIMMSAYILAMGSLCVMRYHAFQSVDWDLAIFNQVLWNTLHGRFMETTLRHGNYFKDHFSPILLVMLPIYAVWQQPLFLLVWQTVFIGLGGFAVFMVARRVVPAYLALLLSAAYFCYPALHYINLFEFHPECMAPCLLLVAFFFYQSASFWPFAVCLVLSVMCKEDIALMAIMFGVMAFVQRQPRRWVVFPVLFGACWFLAVVGFVIPALNQGQYVYATLYENFGHGPVEIVGNMLGHPLKVLSIIFVRHKLLYLFKLLLPVGFLSLLSPVYLIPAVPTLLLNLLTTYAPPASICCQYNAVIVPFIFISAIHAAGMLAGAAWVTRRHPAWLVAALVPLLSALSLSPLARMHTFWPDAIVDSADTARASLLAKVPRDASVIANFQLLAHLASRPVLYSFHELYSGRDKLTRLPTVFEHPIDLAVLDYSDRQTFAAFYDPESGRRMRGLLNDGWKMITASDSMAIIAKRSDAPGLEPYRLLESAAEAGPGFTAFGASWAPYVTLDTYRFSSERHEHGTDLHLSFVWSCQQTVPTDFDVMFTIRDASRSTIFQVLLPTSYYFLPGRDWVPRTYVLNQFDVHVPEDVVPRADTLLLGLVTRPDDLLIGWRARNERANVSFGFVQLDERLERRDGLPRERRNDAR